MIEIGQTVNRFFKFSILRQTIRLKVLVDIDMMIIDELGCFSILVINHCRHRLRQHIETFLTPDNRHPILGHILCQKFIEPMS